MFLRTCRGLGPGLRARAPGPRPPARAPARTVPSSPFPLRASGPHRRPPPNLSSLQFSGPDRICRPRGQGAPACAIIREGVSSEQTNMWLLFVLSAAGAHLGALGSAPSHKIMDVPLRLDLTRVKRVIQMAVKMIRALKLFCGFD